MAAQRGNAGQPLLDRNLFNVQTETYSLVYLLFVSSLILSTSIHSIIILDENNCMIDDIERTRMYSYISNCEVLDLYGLFSDYVETRMIPDDR